MRLADSLLVTQHGVPRVSAAALDKSEAAREKERKHIEQYRALEKEVGEKVSFVAIAVFLSFTSDILQSAACCCWPA